VRLRVAGASLCVVATALAGVVALGGAAAAAPLSFAFTGAAQTYTVTGACVRSRSRWRAPMAATQPLARAVSAGRAARRWRPSRFILVT
jgi:hypothetical protein